MRRKRPRLTAIIGNVSSPQRTPEASEIRSSEDEEYQQRHQDIFSTQSQNFEDTKEDVETLEITEEPKTPTKKRFRNLWHGLPSPDTPTFQHSRRGTFSADVSKASTNGTSEDAVVASPSLSDYKDVATAQDTIESDIMLAQELEDSRSPTTARRSTRLRTVPKPNCKSLKKPSFVVSDLTCPVQITLSHRPPLLPALFKNYLNLPNQPHSQRQSSASSRSNVILWISKDFRLYAQQIGSYSIRPVGALTRRTHTPFSTLV